MTVDPRWRRLWDDPVARAAVVAAAVVLWLAVALVDLRVLALLPLIAGGTYVALRVRGPLPEPPDEDDWY